MSLIFIIKDKTGRSIRLTDERWQHLSKHLHIQQDAEKIKETLQNPDKITDYSYDKNIRHYYKYYKNRVSRAKYLRTIVKYLNGDGFIVTAHFVDRMR